MDHFDERPFERRDNNLSWQGWARLGVAVVTLVPLRVVVALALLVAYAANLQLMIWTGASKSALQMMTRRAARAMLAICGFWWIEEVNRPTEEQLRKARPLVIVSNHVSYLEILYFLASPICPAFLMKATCMQVPLVGSIALKLGCILVDRGNASETERNSSGATNALLEHVKGMKKEYESDKTGKFLQPVLVFPEGTTSNGNFILPFRTGAFVAGAPVLPVLVEFPFEKNGGFSCAYESVSTPVHIVRMLSQFRHQMKVTYLNTYNPTKKEKGDPSLFAKNVRQQMAEGLKVPLSDQTYKEKIEYHSFLRKKYLELGRFALYRYVRPDLEVQRRHTPEEEKKKHR